MSWKRIALYVVALNLLLFFRGCEQAGEIRLTAGAFVPYQLVEIDEGGVFEGIGIQNFSLPLLILNLALCTGLLVLVKTYFKRLDAFLARRAFLVIAAITFVIFNLVLVPNHLWLYAVFWPTGYLYEAATNVIYGAEPASTATAVIDTISRLYFLIFIAVLSLIPLLCTWIKRKLALPPGPSCLAERGDPQNP